MIHYCCYGSCKCQSLIRINPHFVFLGHIQSVGNLHTMFIVEIWQQHVVERVPSLVVGHVIIPASYCRSKTTGHVGFLNHINDGDDVGSEEKGNRTSARQSASESVNSPS